MKNEFVECLYKKGVAVIGAGTMGAGIAQVIAQQEIPVILCDKSLGLCRSGKAKIESSLQEAVGRRILDEKRAAACLGRIHLAENLEDTKAVALAIEAVFEDFEVKAKLFEELGRIADRDTIFATNTSSFCVHDLAVRSGRAEQVGGLHFFYHPAKNRLLEVVSHQGTSLECETALWTFAKSIKKVAIKTADTAGFAVNRFFVPWLNEAVRLYEENEADIPTIEAAAKDAFQISMGPFELMNVTGIPIAMHAATSLEQAFGDFYAPAHRLVEKANSSSLWPLEGSCDTTMFQAVRDRLLGAVFLCAASLVQEGVATMEDTDRGAMVGLRWGEGPFQMMNRFGLSESLALVRKLTRWYFDVAIPENLYAHGVSKQLWSLSYIDLEIKDKIARIILNRPEAMNALNPCMTAELKKRFEEAERCDEVEAIVFEGVGKAFVAGADIHFFVEAIEGKDFNCIYNFTKEGQDLFRQIAESDKLTVAFVDGLALGGGAELALACKKIVAGESARFAFPETGIGIYPGLGGTQRLPRRIGRERARYLIFTGQPVSATDALGLGLADALLSPFENKIVDAMERARICVEKVQELFDGRLEEPKWVKVANVIFSDRAANETISLKKPQDIPRELEEQVEKVLKALAGRAPIALSIAERLIEDGSGRPLTDALSLELNFLHEIFNTKDAYEGLTSVGKRTPVYKKM
jgi:enoyl-CoA hydratase/3-hydroxyacyl-CoA dehydrogenase